MTGFPDKRGAARLRSAADLGQVVRTRRRAQKLTQEELGLLVGAHRPRIVELEKGQPTDRIELLFRVLDALGLDLVVRPRDAHRGEP
jgi:transcriptional regulator with XRE-family HTH domain